AVKVAQTPDSPGAHRRRGPARGRRGAGPAQPDRSSGDTAPMDDPAKDAIRRASRGAVRQALSVSVAVGTYGVSFGALSVSAGLDLLQTMALSLLMFTGGSQFAFIGVLGAGGAGAAAIATAGLLGARNALYGIQMAPLLRVRG